MTKQSQNVARKPELQPTRFQKPEKSAAASLQKQFSTQARPVRF